jgi:hypothetical protein
MTRSAAASLIVLALCPILANAEQVASDRTVIAQNPLSSHCNERPYGECMRCATARGYSRPEARLHCRMMR